MHRRRIIINADDLGLCPSVNRAIFEVFRAGNLTSATLMVDMPGTSDAVGGLAANPGLAVGLHFNITEGRALAGRSSLTDADGMFLPRGQLFKAALRGTVQAQDVRKELHAQLLRMEELGVKPDHLDSHQHAMMFPAVFAAVRPMVEERGLPVRIVRPTRATIARDLVRPGRMAKQLLNMRFAARNARGLRVPTNDRLVSIHDLNDPGPYTAHTYERLLQAARPGEVVELMVHPYLLGEDVMDLYRTRIKEKLPFLQRCAAEHSALSVASLFGEYERISFADIA